MNNSFTSISWTIIIIKTSVKKEVGNVLARHQTKMHKLLTQRYVLSGCSFDSIMQMLKLN